jgi:hypothetical protein
MSVKSPGESRSTPNAVNSIKSNEADSNPDARRQRVSHERHALKRVGRASVQYQSLLHHSRPVRDLQERIG